MKDEIKELREEVSMLRERVAALEVLIKMPYPWLPWVPTPLYPIPPVTCSSGTGK